MIKLLLALLGRKADNNYDALLEAYIKLLDEYYELEKENYNLKQLHKN